MFNSKEADRLFDIEGKVVFITGAGGIGKALAMAMVKLGAQVFVGDCQKENLREVQVHLPAEQVYELDIGNPAALGKSFSDVLERRGRFDVLIHTAAISENGDAVDFAQESLQRIIDINLMGTIYANQQAANVMKKAGRGKIINFASIAGLMTHTFSSMPYEASKAAIMQVTRSFATRLARDGINVNAIAPGWVRTPMTCGKGGAVYKEIELSTPMGRIGKPEDLCGAVVFLASKASDFVTGQTIFVDGGWSVSKAIHW